jgi:DNA-binding MarR family transcriptional regulator
VSSKSNNLRPDQVAELSERIGRDLATKTVLFHSALAGRLGLSATDLKCLDLLRDSQTPLTATNLVDRTGLTGGAITGVADRLETAGFVERVRDPNDRRRWELRPLPDRQLEVAALFTPFATAISELCDAYTTQDLSVIIDFLTKLGDLMDVQTDRMRSSRREGTADRERA